MAVGERMPHIRIGRTPSETGGEQTVSILGRSFQEETEERSLKKGRGGAVNGKGNWRPSAQKAVTQPIITGETRVR